MVRVRLHLGQDSYLVACRVTFGHLDVLVFLVNSLCAELVGFLILYLLALDYLRSHMLLIDGAFSMVVHIETGDMVAAEFARVRGSQFSGFAPNDNLLLQMGVTRSSPFRCRQVMGRV